MIVPGDGRIRAEQASSLRSLVAWSTNSSKRTAASTAAAALSGGATPWLNARSRAYYVEFYA
jgi:hypothetical protein